MKKKKVILIFIIITIILSLVTIIFVSTRTVYWHNEYYEFNQPSKTDAEYLGVWDIRLLYSKDKNEINDLCTNIVNDSLKYNGILPNELQGVIPKHIFSYINPRDFLSEKGYIITDEQFEIKESDVLRYKNKAIFLYGCEYHATYLKNNKSNDYGVGYDGVPDRLYLEYINGQWIVTSAFRP